MSNKQDTTKSNNIEPKFDEYQAYEELRLIFVIAIETQDFSTLETRIGAWEKKYPLAEFTDPEIIRKIKAILNKDFLSRLLGDYLAAQILHEQEKQREAYDSLKAIIVKAKKTKDYKTAQKEIRKWKDNLYANGFTLYGFDRLYRARVCTLLLLPSKELKNQEQATEELKKIKENGNSMDSKSYLESISNWQNTYSISDFPDKLKEELNQITTEVFDSISQKRTSENAILEIENVLSSKDIPLPANAIASILSKYDYKSFPQESIDTIENLSMQAMSIQDSVLDDSISRIDLSVMDAISPTESKALTSLKDILNATPHDMDTILNWIYVNRKINYSKFARENIVRLFSAAGYKIPEQNSYSIPEIDITISYTDTGKIDDLRRTVILNYLGIISQGNKLSIEGKDNLIESHTVSAKESLAKKVDTPVMFLEAFDTVIEQPEVEEEKPYDEKGKINEDKNEEIIYNIFIEDIIDNPLATYSISTDKSVSSSISYSDQTVLKKSEEDLETASELDNKTISSNPQEIVIINDISERIEPETETTTSSSESENKTVSVSSQEIAITDDTSEVPRKEPSTIFSEDAGVDYSLTSQDNKNIEQAYSLSTYVIIAAPILEQALNPKQIRSHRKQKFAERNKDL